MKKLVLSIFVTTLIFSLMGCSKTNSKKTSYEVPAVEITKTAYDQKNSNKASYEVSAVEIAN